MHEKAIISLYKYKDQLRENKIYYHNKNWPHLVSEIVVALYYVQSAIDWLEKEQTEQKD